MRLNHLNLTVTNVDETRAFLEAHFGLSAVPGVGASNFALLHDDDDMAVTLLAGAAGKEVRYPPTFHIGFIQPTEDAVDEIHRRLTADGYSVPAPKRFHGSWTFYVTAPGGFLVEVLC